MKKKTKISLIVLLSFISLATGFICHEEQASARRIKIKPGSHVFDPLRYAQQVLSNAQKSVINGKHVAKIQNQLKDLQNIGSDFLTAFSSIAKENTSSMLKAHNEATGALEKSIAANQLMDSKFKVLTDEEFSNGAFVEEEKQRRLFLHDTYKDAYRSSKYILQNFDRKMQSIEKLNDASTQGEGNLAQYQAKNMQAAEQLQSDIASMQLEASIASIKNMHRQALVVQEGLSRRRGQDVKQISFDPYNPTTEDESLYSKKPAQGFIRFK